MCVYVCVCAWVCSMKTVSCVLCVRDKTISIVCVCMCVCVCRNESSIVCVCVRAR